MSLAVYVHVPYCLQRCRYCDFTTFEANQIMPSADYVSLVRAEIKNRAANFSPGPLSSLYFGGGTPSLLPSHEILAIIDELANAGFSLNSNSEVTIEINPATVDPQKLEDYLKSGINRFSVGAQTFSDELLQLCGRRHSAADTRHTLKLLKDHGVNYSFDLLFALPGQTMAMLERDLDEVLEFAPPHLSAYCLTVPEGHPMGYGRPLEDEQVRMFARIESRLKEIALEKYEISNFARLGAESRHNLAYWTDRPYWGIGLSAHSYLPLLGSYGTRFWNPKDFHAYADQVALSAPVAEFPEVPLGGKGFEALSLEESMTDFAHMHLRTKWGLSLSAVRKKYGERPYQQLADRLPRLVADGLLEIREDRAVLSTRGTLLANLVLSELLFS